MKTGITVRRAVTPKSCSELAHRPRRPCRPPWRSLEKSLKLRLTSGELKQLLQVIHGGDRSFSRFFPRMSRTHEHPLTSCWLSRIRQHRQQASEVDPYLKFLIYHGFYDLAYYTWLQFLPPEQLNKAGNLFNGSFEVIPTGLPFDWTFTRESGATIEIADRTDGKGAHALFLEFGVGRVEGLSVKQMVILAPGDYQFRGTYKADIVSQRGLQWRVICASKSGR